MAIDALVAPFLRLEIFQGLSIPQIEEIARGAERVVFRPGDVIVNGNFSNEGAVLLVSGEAVIAGERGYLNGPNVPIPAGSLLNDHGFGQDAISVEAYSAEGAADPPIRVSYLRYVAEPPQCGDWSANLAYDPTNLPYPNLGCSQQRNLAVMVANPSDLLGPRSETARSGERRDQVWGKYVTGQPTGARKSIDERVNRDNSN